MSRNTGNTLFKSIWAEMGSKIFITGHPVLSSDYPNFNLENKDRELADNYVMAKKNMSFYKLSEKLCQWYSV